MSRVSTQPFGSARGPASWGRVVTRLQRAIATLARVPLLASLGDVLSAEQVTVARSAFPAAKEIIELCGFGLEDSKVQEAATSISLVGRTLELHERHVAAAITPVRLASLSRKRKSTRTTMS